LSDQDNLQENLKKIETRLEKDPDDRHMLLQAARLYHRYAMRGDELGYERAGDAVARLLRLDKENVEALAIRGSLLTIRVRRTRGLLKRMWYAFKAARVLDRAVKLDPENLSARTIRAFTALVMPGFLRRLGRAIGDFEFLVRKKEAEPDSLPDEMMPKVFLNLGLAYAKKGEMANARDALEYVIETYPGTGESNRARSVVEKLSARGRM
jgi:tetratricopeptide (TPR) repeat protein